MSLDCKPRKKWACIGSGTYGKVYRMQDSQACVKEMKRIAIHTSSSEPQPEPETVNMREFILASSLHHPHIIHANRVDVHKQHVRMHMDYKGITLADWVANTPFVQRAAVFWKIMSQLVHTHLFLHRHGIQQVDCRPTNVLIDEHTHHVTIIDLGLVSLKGLSNHEDMASYPTRPLTTWNRWSQCYGTWVYCPPEVVVYHHVHDNTITWNVALIGMFMLLGANVIQEYLPPDADISARQPVLQLLRQHEESWAKGIVLREKDAANIDVLPWGQEWMQLFHDMTRWDVHQRLTLFSIQGCSWISNEYSRVKTVTMANTAVSSGWWREGREHAIMWMKDMALKMNCTSLLTLSIWLMDMYMTMLERMEDKKVLLKEIAHVESHLVPLVCLITTYMMYDVHGDKVIKTWMKAATHTHDTFEAVYKKLWTLVRTCFCHCWSPLPQLVFPHICTISKEDLASAVCTTFTSFDNEPYTMQDVNVYLNGIIRRF